MNTPQQIKVNVPEIATKQHKIYVNPEGKRRITVSSNWLPLFGFDSMVEEVSLGKGKGFKVVAVNTNYENHDHLKKVYTRNYNSRKGNILKNPRTEKLIQTSNQDLINDSMGDSTHVHITFKQGELTFTPVNEKQYIALKQLDPEQQINTLVALTGGVDAHLLEQNGFRIDVVCERRPQEARDKKTDYTEMTSLNCLVNSAPRILINEDFYNIDVTRLANLIGKSPITFMHVSLCCTEFTPVKHAKDKLKALDNMTSTIDMFLPMLNMLDAIKAPVLMVENVPAFAKSQVYDLLKLQLRRRGYDVHMKTFDAREYGGYTSRERMYMVATTLDTPLDFPQPFESDRHVWKDIIEPNLAEIMDRDVTDTKVMKDSISSGYARIIKESDGIGKKNHFSNSLGKFQGQDTKDSLTVEYNDRNYRLPVIVQRLLNEIPDTFNVDWCPIDKAAQIIGQSISCALHGEIIKSIKKHINLAQMNFVLSSAA